MGQNRVHMEVGQNNKYISDKNIDDFRVPLFDQA